MSIAQRVERLRERHGDSRVQAEARTGVSRETIRRIENGETPSTLMHHLERIAAGYGVPLACLVEGHDPKGDFEWFILEASPVERVQMAILTIQERLRLLIGFLRTNYPSLLEPVGVAAATGLRQEEVHRILRGAQKQAPDRQTCIKMVRGISRLTGIDPNWVLTGYRPGEPGLTSFQTGVFTLSVKSGKKRLDGEPAIRALCDQAEMFLRNWVGEVTGDRATTLHSAG